MNAKNNKVLQLIIINTIFTLQSGICAAGPATRIVGGETTRIQEYPYQISMRWMYGVPKPMHFCGGSIVSKNHIVTAAHCVEDKRSPHLMKYIKIYAGTSRSDSVDGKAYGVKSIAVHPGYKGASNTYLDDIAVVTLSESIEFNESQRPINLPTKDVQNNGEAVITGWGNTWSTQGDTPLYLQKTPMKLMNNNQCRYQFPHSLRNTQVCAFMGRGVGVCSGDSGGPLVSNGELIGVASYVLDCAKGYPDVYTNVYSYVSFISQVMNKNYSSC